MTKHFIENKYQTVNTINAFDAPLWYCSCKPQNGKARVIYLDTKPTPNEIIIQCKKHFRISLLVTPQKFLSGQYKILQVIN